MNPTLFQYCQKIVIFRNDCSEVLVARRKGEADFDEIYSFIGGKLETSDGGLEKGLAREKDEEVGKAFKIKICPDISFNAYYVKQNGHHMVLPHFFAEYSSGEVVLNEEYSDYAWVKWEEFKNFEPKIDNMYTIAARLLQLRKAITETEFIEI